MCNILNQNPRFHASSTSPIAETVRRLSALWTDSSEVKSDSIVDQEGTQARIVRSPVALIKAWYEDKEKAEVVFDKGRLWTHQPLVQHQLFPDSHQFVCVRDLRDVFASAEKQHAKNPMYDGAKNPAELTSFGRAMQMLTPDGMMGGPAAGVVDLGRRQLPYVHFITFESFVMDPKFTLDSIYKAIGEESFEHDFKDVKSTATDVDGLYHYKFPHDGSGEVKAPEGTWRDHVSQDIADEIMKSFPKYNKQFNYLPAA